ncbi:uncharacterized protein [Salminus brasiliensis]|uniref:uncharacterized protein n=1 Tax=Salminus brasiliensis TaxID=930266 RepID=UPI003B832493
MKTSRSKKTAALPAAPEEEEEEEEEECGVWLDAAEFRTKRQKQRKRLTRPISKLLNPLARSGGYSMAVALNFTQTKMQMPATKQSTISSFFLPQSKKNKDPEERSSHPSEISSTLRPELQMGTKRKRVVTTEYPLEPDKETSHTSQVHPQELDADLLSESGEHCTDQTKEQHFFQLIWGYQSEEEEPADVNIEYGSEIQKECNKAISHGIQDIPETLLHTEQVHEDSHEHYRQVHRNDFRANKGGSSAPCSAKEFPSQENSRDHHLMDKIVSSPRPILTTRSVTENQPLKKRPRKALELSEQKPHRTQWSPLKRKDKENRAPISPTHSTALSPLKHLLASSPAKRFSNFGKPSVFQKAKLNQSPKKSVKESVESEQDSFAMLFTQDSEGFRVIANRSKQTRCPLKDWTNSPESRESWILPSEKPLETEDSDLEPEMLFTQDSQGNMVIKH